MTREEKERLLAEIEKQYKWLMTKSPTIYMMDIAFDAIRKTVRDEAEQEPKISLDTYKQVTKERDIAIEQLRELGYEFGEKIEPTTKNCESCRYYGSHHEVCNYCYKCSLWTEQEATTKNDLGVDAVSRKAVHDMLENLPITVEDKWFNWLQKACMRLAKLPSVTPREPILDKIRDEIEKEIIPRNSDQYDHEAMWQNMGLRMTLKVIDKYKTESEGKK